MSGIKNYRTTAGNNTSVGGISIAEGMLPSNINNAFRAFAADIREFYNDSQWVIYGDGDGAHTFAYVSGTAFTVAGANVTAFYHAGRRVKAVGSSTVTQNASGLNPVRKSGRYIRANVKIPAGTTFTHAQGVDFIASQAGIR